MCVCVCVHMRIATTLAAESYYSLEFELISWELLGLA